MGVLSAGDRVSLIHEGSEKVSVNDGMEYQGSHLGMVFVALGEEHNKK
jgi:hypothetical protein